MAETLLQPTRRVVECKRQPSKISRCSETPLPVRPHLDMPCISTLTRSPCTHVIYLPVLQLFGRWSGAARLAVGDALEAGKVHRTLTRQRFRTFAAAAARPHQLTADILLIAAQSVDAEQQLRRRPRAGLARAALLRSPGMLGTTPGVYPPALCPSDRPQSECHPPFCTLL